MKWLLIVQIVNINKKYSAWLDVSLQREVQLSSHLRLTFLMRNLEMIENYSYYLITLTWRWFFTSLRLEACCFYQFFLSCQMSPCVFPSSLLHIRHFLVYIILSIHFYSIYLILFPYFHTTRFAIIFYCTLGKKCAKSIRLVKQRIKVCYQKLVWSRSGWLTFLCFFWRFWRRRPPTSESCTCQPGATRRPKSNSTSNPPWGRASAEFWYSTDTTTSRRRRMWRAMNHNTTHINVYLTFERWLNGTLCSTHTGHFCFKRLQRQQSKRLLPHLQPDGRYVILMKKKNTVHI